MYTRLCCPHLGKHISNPLMHGPHGRTGTHAISPFLKIVLLLEPNWCKPYPPCMTTLFSLLFSFFCNLLFCYSSGQFLRFTSLVCSYILIVICYRHSLMLFADLVDTMPRLLCLWYVMLLRIRVPSLKLQYKFIKMK